MRLILMTFFLIGNTVRSFGKTVPVIEFLSHVSPSHVAVEDTPNSEFLKTNGLTLCVRFMTRFSKRHRLIKTNQFSLWLKNTKEFTVFLRIWPSNSTSINDEYSRILILRPYIPGEWVSVCFSIHTTLQTQEIEFFQDGALRSHTKYNESNFELFHHRNPLTLKDM